MKRILFRVVMGLLVVAALLIAAIWLTTIHPAEIESKPVSCPDQTPMLTPGQSLRVMSWNVQYMAGKDYVFWYDMFDESGPDERPSPEVIVETLAEVARVISDEQPDVVLLQEMDDGAARTDGMDQLAELSALLGGDFPCSTTAYYWKAVFVPHPKVMGGVGMELATLSKYRIDEAIRYDLAEMPADPLTRQFNLKRAVLEVRFPIEGGGEFVAFNTHLDAFAQGSDTMERQVEEIHGLLLGMEVPWVIGGDFNLLPPGSQYSDLPPDQRLYYAPETEIETLFEDFQSVPSLAAANGVERADWFTHYPNDPAVQGPDRTIDYLFFSDEVGIVDSEVRRSDTLDISDHLPVIAEVDLP